MTSSTSSESPQTLITVTAPINIAFIKYWGKRPGGEKLILPTNDSFSITLSTEPFRSKTSVLLTDKLPEDVLWLNSEKTESMASNKRLLNVLSSIRATAPPHLAALKALIVSDNNFPTAAGMASSASGYCALATALVKAFASTADVSVLARIGSGSACRSSYGGFVKWLMGHEEDGSDCRAVPFVDNTYWPEINVLCAVLKGAKKDIGSTEGMQLSLATSPMMGDRINHVVPQRMEAVAAAIKARDFETFAAITMADSDDLQAVCATTTPRVQYATEASYAVIRFVHSYNRAKGRRAAAYTYDAGANAFLFVQEKDLAEFTASLLSHFPIRESAAAAASTEDDGADRKKKKVETEEGTTGGSTSRPTSAGSTPAGWMFHGGAALVASVKKAQADLAPELAEGRLLAAADEEGNSGEKKEEGEKKKVEKEQHYIEMLLQSPVGAGPQVLPDETEALIDVAALGPKSSTRESV